MRRRSSLVAAFLLPLAAAAVPVALRLWVHWRVRPRVYRLGASIPESEVALVLGAGLWPNGELTPVLYDRVATGVDLYRTGRVKKLLMSGDGGSRYASEPEVMRRAAIELGVPPEDIWMDCEGYRTLDSVARARRVWHVERAAIVTQRFHIDRSLYLAEALGLDAVGVAADRRRYRFLAYQKSRLREVVATVNAWMDVHL